jgi:predicted enzyme related to lactoylglutathione lyase
MTEPATTERISTASTAPTPSPEHPTVDLALGPLGQVLVPVTDVDRAVAFYGEVLDLPLLFRYPGNAFFDAGGGVRLYLGVATDAEFTGRTTFYLRSTDIKAAVTEIARRGGRIRQRAHVAHREATYELWLAFVDDPDGNHVGLMQEIRIDA